VEPEERTLIKMLARYPEMLEGAARTLEIHRITFYLNELAGAFHSYYNRNKVVTDNASLSAARLVLIDAVRVVLANALKILGVNAPEKM
jgi:arginyl-tRNA synthetase